jgi:uncharacterized protein YdiU (UPF0061 family)
VKFRFESNYSALGDGMFSFVNPERVSSPRIVLFNDHLASELGLGAWDESHDLPLLAGNHVPGECHPLAQAYAGHQYGHFTRLGDGRALLLGEHRVPASGRLVDIHLKGSGRTPYSRRGDGRAALGPMVREFIVSEAMHSLGIPTTRSLAVVSTGDPVVREGLLAGAVLTRVADSHVRVGTFEWALASAGTAQVKRLADFCIARHFDSIGDAEDRYAKFFASVCEKQARLIASWLGVGFVHGVMNTDNMLICGQTIDYGPCAFLEEYHPEAVFSSIDHHGRYAFGNQPGIALWNLQRLGECLQSLFQDPTESLLKTHFVSVFQDEWQKIRCAKIGLESTVEGAEIADEWLAIMAELGLDFTNAFVALEQGFSQKGESLSIDLLMQKIGADLPQQRQRVEAWLTRWKSAGPAIGRFANNPRIVARNHQVERAIQSAYQGDLEPANRLVEALRRPFDESIEFAEFRVPAAPSERVLETFCGT